MKKNRLHILQTTLALTALALVSVLVLSGCGFVGKSLARQVSDLTKKAAALEKKAAEIEEKAANLSAKDRRKYQEELARLGFDPPQGLFNDPEALLSGAEDDTVEGLIGGVLGLLRGLGGKRGGSSRSGRNSGGVSEREMQQAVDAFQQILGGIAGGKGGGSSVDNNPGAANEAPNTPTPSEGSGVVVMVWPNSGILAEFGLSGLLTPSGATGISWMMETGTSGGNLSISFTGSPANDSAVTRCFASNGWTLDRTEAGDGTIGYSYSKVGFESGVWGHGGDSFVIQIQKSGSGAVWPTSGHLAEYGLSGFSAPAGATDINWSMMAGPSFSYLGIGFTSAAANDSAIKNRFASNGWSLLNYIETESITVYKFSKPGFSGGYQREGDSYGIVSAKE